MIFLRHPTPDIEAGICYGQLDMGIAEIGHSQIEKALQTTPKLKKIVASPALRCRKLTVSLAERDNLEPIILDERLWEMNMGDFEGQRWDALDRNLSEDWLKDALNNPTPNGEAFIDLQYRVLEAIDDHASEDIAFVCHAGPIRAVQMAFHGISFKEAFSTAPPYAEPIKILPSK